MSSSSADPDADLLARFAALKAPSAVPGSTQSALDAAKASADAEDRALADIAAGRLGSATSTAPSGNLRPHSQSTPPPPLSHSSAGPSLASPAGSATGSQAVSASGRVPAEIDDDATSDDAIRNYYAADISTTRESPFSNDINALRKELDPEVDRQRDLSLEIADALKVADGARRRASAASERRRSLDLGLGDSDVREHEFDQETEDEIIQRALDAARTEAKQAEQAEGSHGGSSAHDDAVSDEPAAEPSAGGSSTSGAAGRSSSGGAEALLSLPSLPSLPALPDDEPPLEPEEKARMDALLGLKGPSNFPSAPSKAPKEKGPGPAPASFNFPGMQSARDDDLDSWCSICNKDATVQCADCEGDLYCAECWREHKEDDPDHRGKKFVWAKPQQQ